MAEEVNLSGMLIEGYDSTRVKPVIDYDKDWQKVVGARQNGTILQAEISGFENISEKDCAVVQVGNIRGYIPMELVGVENLRQLRAMAGKKVAFKVLEYIEDADRKIFMASRLSALEEMSKITLRRLEVGQTTLAVVSLVSPTLVRADIGGIQVNIPVGEVRYGWIADLTKEIKVGDHLNVKVMSIDTETKEVAVSIKALLDNPWESCEKRFKVGGEYIGTVTGSIDYGVFINLGEGIDSLASLLKFQEVHPGDKVLIRVLLIDIKKEEIRSRIVRVI